MNSPPILHSSSYPFGNIHIPIPFRRLRDSETSSFPFYPS